jgi:hypothetical protein
MWRGHFCENYQLRKSNNMEATPEHPVQSLTQCTRQNQRIATQENRTTWKQRPGIQCKVSHHAHAETKELPTRRTEQHGSGARASNAKSHIMRTPKPKCHQPDNPTTWKRRLNVRCKVSCHAHTKTKELPTKKTEQHPQSKIKPNSGMEPVCGIHFSTSLHVESAGTSK